jgi:hypothetical protein
MKLQVYTAFAKVFLGERAILLEPHDHTCWNVWLNTHTCLFVARLELTSMSAFTTSEKSALRSLLVGNILSLSKKLKNYHKHSMECVENDDT